MYDGATTQTVWTFKTKRFTVALILSPCYDLDLSWDESGEVVKKIESGDYIPFDSELRVSLDGRTLASDHLGQSVYDDVSDFWTAHRDTDPMNRNCSIMHAARGNVMIGHYFPDMVREAIREARDALTNLPEMREVTQ